MSTNITTYIVHIPRPVNLIGNQPGNRASVTEQHTWERVECRPIISAATTENTKHTVVAFEVESPEEALKLQDMFLGADRWDPIVTLHW